MPDPRIKVSSIRFTDIVDYSKMVQKDQAWPCNWLKNTIK